MVRECSHSYLAKSDDIFAPLSQKVFCRKQTRLVFNLNELKVWSKYTQESMGRYIISRKQVKKDNLLAKVHMSEHLARRLMTFTRLALVPLIHEFCTRDLF